VNRDNLLFATIGVLLGFIAGYLMHEVMVARQPLRRPPGEGGVVSADQAAGQPGADAPNGGGGDPAGDASGQGSDRSGAGQVAAGPGGQDAAGSGAAAGAPGGAPASGAPPVAPMAEVQRLRDYVATHPKDADAVLKLANMNFDIRNWGRARDLYTQYLGLRDGDADARTDLGVCYRELRQFDSALDQFRHVESISPTHWKALFDEVVVLGIDLKQFDAADKAMARLKALVPAEPEVAQLASELQRRRAAG
jgi:hypothetical protein